MQKDYLYQKIDHGKIRCLACNHYCLILEGRTGVCGVRQNQNDNLKLLVKNQVVALHIDPIEKKPLYHFLPGSSIMSFGTYGCNLRCDFCQNFDISQGMKNQMPPRSISNDLRTQQVKEWGKKITPVEIVELTLKNNLQSIAYTYNEPTVFIEFALETMKLAHDNGLKNVWVSNGFMSKEALNLILPYLDAINVDLKSYSDDFYRRICGGRLQPVLDNITAISNTNVHLELTTLLIPGLNDSDEELSTLSEFISSLNPYVPWHLSRFFPTYKMLDCPETPLATLEKARVIGQRAGLKHIYLGNI